MAGHSRAHPPAKDQPYYHLLAENDESAYVAYVSQQNLVHDENGEPVKHPPPRKSSNRLRVAAIGYAASTATRPPVRLYAARACGDVDFAALPRQ